MFNDNVYDDHNISLANTVFEMEMKCKTFLYPAYFKHYHITAKQANQYA